MKKYDTRIVVNKKERNLQGQDFQDQWDGDELEPLV